MAVRERFKLSDDEIVVTAFAENASGPGWSNSPIRVVVKTRAGDLVEHWIQPCQQTEQMRTLYAVSEAAHISMSSVVNDAGRRKAKSK